MSISAIPQSYTHTLTGGIGTTLGGALNANLVTPGVLATSVALTASPMTVTLAGIPNDITIGIDEIPEIKLGITQLPPVEIKLTELPAIRAHLPANFNVGFSLLGVELMNIRLCGEAQMITEPYRENPCEGCGPRAAGVVDIADAVALVERLTATESRRTS